VPEGPRGGQNSPWLHEQLCERRIVLVTRRLDDAVAARAAAALISLDAASDAPIELHVNSPDGTLDAAFVLDDVLGSPRRHDPAIGVIHLNDAVPRNAVRRDLRRVQSLSRERLHRISP
jgi:ATP-dependent protease ClpP protease subunit